MMSPDTDFRTRHPDPAIAGSRSMVDVIRYRADTEPDLVVFKFLDDGVQVSETITIQLLDQKARAVAEKLQQSGKKGERVVLLFPPGMAYIISLFGCFYAGMVAVPAYPPRRNRSSNRVFRIIEDAGISHCLTNAQVLKDIERNFAADFENHHIRWISFEEIDLTRFDHWNAPDLAEDDLALLQYTSGSTGEPKGVMISHFQILYNSEYIGRSFGFSKASVGMNWLPIYHDMGLIGTIMQGPYFGFLSITMPPMVFLQDPAKWLKAISAHKATIAGGPNFAYDHCVNKVDLSQLDGVDLSSIETFFCGAEPVRRQTLEAFAEKFSNHGVNINQMYPCYGMAETVLIVTGGMKGSAQRFVVLDQQALNRGNVVVVDEQHPDHVHFTGCGHCWLDTRVRIVNPETCMPSAANEVGEIWISGSGVSRGYWGRTNGNELGFGYRLADEPEKEYFRSGDLGFMIGEELFVTGRIKDLMIFRGVNVYPTDVEFLAQQAHPSLRQNAGAAFSVMVDGEERLVLVQEVERSSMHNLPSEAIFSVIRQVIAEEFELSIYAILLLRPGSLPLTSSGKIQRRVAKYGYLTGNLQVIESWQQAASTDNLSAFVPHTPTADHLREWLTQWIHQRLHIPLNEIDADKQITAYGLDSLAAVSLESEINNHFGNYWHISMFMMDTSINQLVIEGMRIYAEESGLEKN